MERLRHGLHNPPSTKISHITIFVLLNIPIDTVEYDFIISNTHDKMRVV